MKPSKHRYLMPMLDGSEAYITLDAFHRPKEPARLADELVALRKYMAERDADCFAHLKLCTKSHILNARHVKCSNGKDWLTPVKCVFASRVREAKRHG